MPIDIDGLTRQEKEELLALLQRQDGLARIKNAQTNLLEFAKHVYPAFKEGPHHRVIWKVIQDLLAGDKKRVIINIAPRMGKSLLLSWLLPAFYLGLNPTKKIIMATHTASLSEDFGRQVRNLIGSAEYRDIFKHTMIASDKKAAGQWGTTQRGEYYATGVGGALAGRGADLCVVDDPHSEQDVATSGPAAFEKAWRWFQTGPMQRLMPEGRLLVIMTRWSEVDLSGRLMEFSEQNPDADQWELVKLPPILPSGRSLWPEQWPIEELLAKKASMSAQYWNAQYCQEPASEEGALLKREWWKRWDEDRPPAYDHVIISLDGAFTAKETSNYSAITVWGVWYKDPESGGAPQIILLDAYRERCEFPRLKALAIEYQKKWEPSAFVIEAKASGLPLIQELRRMGIPVQDYVPSRGNDKIARVNSITDIFSSGMVWAPRRRWADELIEECAKFPHGANDDFVDCCSMALMRFRQGGFVSLPSDALDEPKYRRRTGGYAV